MTPIETTAVVTAGLSLMAALQAWLTANSLSHGKQLNGLMAPRIAAGAAAVAVVDHAIRGEPATLVPSPAVLARIASLKGELSKLESGSV
jgi:hypothetical protein